MGEHDADGIAHRPARAVATHRIFDEASTTATNTKQVRYMLAISLQSEAIKVHGKLSTNDGEVALNWALDGWAS